MSTISFRFSQLDQKPEYGSNMLYLSETRRLFKSRVHLGRKLVAILLAKPIEVRPVDEDWHLHACAAIISGQIQIHP